MGDGVSFSSFGLSYENLSHFCGTVPPCTLRWRKGGDIKPSHFVILDSSF